MFTPKHTFIASVIAVFTAFHPHVSSAESFTGSDFVRLKRENQLGYIETAIGIAGLIAAENDKRQADCIDNWYYPDKSGKSDIIIEVMKENSEYHPRGIILAVLQKQCGSFKYN